MKNAIIAMTLAAALPFTLVGCGSDEASVRDAGAVPDAGSVGPDAAKLDAEDAPTSVSLPHDAAVDQATPSPKDAMLDQTHGEAKPHPSVDAAVDGGGDAGKPIRLDGPTDVDRTDPALLDGAADLVPTPVDAGGRSKVVLRSGVAYANCMPAISPDPIIAFWEVDISGARGTTAQLTEATVTVTGTTTLVQKFTVDNPTIPLVNGAGSAEQRKPLDQRQPNSACDSMCRGSVTYRLDLVYSVDGESIPLSKSGSFSCAY